MATHQVVDSEKLNAGLTAIGDAIRAKTGASGSLGFPEAMAAAIAGISAGAKVASGTFSPAPDSNYAGSKTLRSSPITISGLGFQPTRVIVFCLRAGSSWVV